MEFQTEVLADDNLTDLAKKVSIKQGLGYVVVSAVVMGNLDDSFLAVTSESLADLPEAVSRIERLNQDSQFVLRCSTVTLMRFVSKQQNNHLATIDASDVITQAQMERADGAAARHELAAE